MVGGFRPWAGCQGSMILQHKTFRDSLHCKGYRRSGPWSDDRFAVTGHEADGGQAAVEYIGVLVVVALIILMVTLAVPDPTSQARAAVCKVTTGGQSQHCPDEDVESSTVGEAAGSPGPGDAESGGAADDGINGGDDEGARTGPEEEGGKGAGNSAGHSGADGNADDTTTNGNPENGDGTSTGANPDNAQGSKGSGDDTGDSADNADNSDGGHVVGGGPVPVPPTAEGDGSGAGGVHIVGGGEPSAPGPEETNSDADSGNTGAGCITFSGDYFDNLCDDQEVGDGNDQGGVAVPVPLPPPGKEPEPHKDSTEGKCPPSLIYSSFAPMPFVSTCSENENTDAGKSNDGEAVPLPPPPPPVKEPDPRETQATDACRPSLIYTPFAPMPSVSTCTNDGDHKDTPPPSDKAEPEPKNTEAGKPNDCDRPAFVPPRSALPMVSICPGDEPTGEGPGSGEKPDPEASCTPENTARANAAPVAHVASGINAAPAAYVTYRMVAPDGPFVPDGCSEPRPKRPCSIDEAPPTSEECVPPLNKPVDPKLVGTPLTYEEKEAIWRYSAEMLFDEMNQALRSGRPLDPKLRKLVEDLSNGLAKLPPYQGEVYRGVISMTPEQLARYVPGSIVTEAGFTSTSSSPDIAMGFQGSVKYKIKSKTGRDISTESESSYEDEVLFDAGTKFRVEQVTTDRGVTTIEMEEV
jgi:ADP-ribosyltransferase exoenzyme